MKSRVRILHLEHSRLDRELVQDALTKVGFDHLLIPATNKAEFIAELSWGTFDIILCDSSLPDLNGQDALRMAREKCPTIPFLFVMENCSSNQVSHLVRAGAADAISKSDLASLADALVAALRPRRQS
jgi:DNA-binding NarL/FixJ family response regulator